MDIENITVEVSTKLFECCICGKQYQSKWALKRHLRCHTDEKEFVCNQCDKAFGFKYMYLLSRHEKDHVSGPMKERHIRGKNVVFFSILLLNNIEYSNTIRSTS